jgi:hypothetical protein
MTRRGRLAFAVLVIALSAALWQGLAGRRPSPELKGVYEEVRASASTDTVLVDVQHEHYLTIGIVGSSFNDLPVARKRSTARDIAGRAYRRYTSPSALRFVVVAFVDQGRRLLVFPERHTRDVTGCGCRGGSRHARLRAVAGVSQSRHVGHSAA